jgi:hypothetical protein
VHKLGQEEAARAGVRGVELLLLQRRAVHARARRRRVVRARRVGGRSLQRLVVQVLAAPQEGATVQEEGKEEAGDDDGQVLQRRVQAATTPARASDASAPKAPRRPAKAGDTARVVRSVDADLYQVPPPDFEPDEPRPTVCSSKLKAHMHPSFFVDNDASQFSVPPVLNSILTVHYLFN